MPTKCVPQCHVFHFGAACRQPLGQSKGQYCRVTSTSVGGDLWGTSWKESVDHHSRLFTSRTVCYTEFSVPGDVLQAGLLFFLFLKGRQQGKERLSSLGNFLLYFYFCFCFFNLEEGTDYKGLK